MATYDIEIQRGIVDVPRAGTTDTPTTFGSLTSAFVLNTCNRFCNAGPSTTGSATYYVDDLSTEIELTATDTITLRRIATSTNANFKASWESWEYKGAAAGPNEFIVRSRNTVSLNNSTRSTTETLDVTPTDIDKCIPFITGISNTDTGVNSNGMTAYCWLSGTNTLNVERGGSVGTTTVQVVTVEFTGSAWSVYHGLNSGYTADTGTITLVDEAAGTGTTIGGISDWTTAIIASIQHRGTTGDVDEAIADNYPTVYPNNSTSVSFYHHGNHAVSAGASQKLMVHVLEHSDITVTRFTDTANAAGESTEDITSAGLTSLDYSAIIGTGASSGGGTAFPRGWRLYYLNSTTQAAHWCYRSGNTFSHRLQIIDFSSVSSTESTTYNETATDSFSLDDSASTTLSISQSVSDTAGLTAATSGTFDYFDSVSDSMGLTASGSHTYDPVYDDNEVGMVISRSNDGFTLVDGVMPNMFLKESGSTALSAGFNNIDITNTTNTVMFAVKLSGTQYIVPWGPVYSGSTITHYRVFADAGTTIYWKVYWGAPITTSFSAGTAGIVVYNEEGDQMWNSIDRTLQVIRELGSGAWTTTSTSSYKDYEVYNATDNYFIFRYYCGSSVLASNVVTYYINCYRRFDANTIRVMIKPFRSFGVSAPGMSQNKQFCSANSDWPNIIEIKA